METIEKYVNMYQGNPTKDCKRIAIIVDEDRMEWSRQRYDGDGDWGYDGHYLDAEEFKYIRDIAQQLIIIFGEVGIGSRNHLWNWFN